MNRGHDWNNDLMRSIVAVCSVIIKIYYRVRPHNISLSLFKEPIVRLILTTMGSGLLTSGISVLCCETRFIPQDWVIKQNLLIQRSCEVDNWRWKETVAALASKEPTNAKFTTQIHVWQDFLPKPTVLIDLLKDKKDLGCSLTPGCKMGFRERSKFKGVDEGDSLVLCLMQSVNVQLAVVQWRRITIHW